MKEPRELVFIPAPGIGHLVSTVEIAKLLVARDDQIFITILIMKFPFDDSNPQGTQEDDYSSISPRIKFISLPELDMGMDTQGMGPGAFFKIFVENQKPNVTDVVTKLTESRSESKPRLAGFVIDMFCTTMIDVANEFGVPTYVFFTSNAACLGFLLHLQAICDEENKDVSEFLESGADLSLPSFINPLPHGVLTSALLDKEGVNAFLNHARRFRETKGILVNTFLELESHALHSLSDGKIPPVYPVGPLLNLKNDDDQQKSDILEWLEDQPPLSVVFLCFGSMGSFAEDQVKEIACALEQSGYRFLWSLRQPPPKGKIAFPSDYGDAKAVLPEGFLDRTAGIGKIIGWAPQIDILAHPSIGGFVSHCGWNSTLESLWYGVPIATWPMYAEQQLNAFGLVRELGLAVEVDMNYRKDGQVVLSAQVIEKGIRQVMEQDSDIRNKVKETSEKSKKALSGGSSYSSLGHFIDQIIL
ncbi:UDP-glycosyltransferase 71A16-like [Rosa sericea]